MHRTSKCRALPSRGLYAISNGPRTDLIDACAAVLRGGAAVLQYRDKTTDHARRHAEASALANLCKRHAVPFIINDDVALAADINADGVHLGEDDTGIDVARERLGGQAIIGVSCYDSLDRARELARAGVDYLAFGAFFPSPTKPHARRATVKSLGAARPLGVPLVAIGGITADNAPQLIAAGADFVAVISAVFATPDPAAAASRFAQLFETRG